MSRRSPRFFSVAGTVICLGLISMVGAACSEDTTDATPEPTTAPPTTVATTTTLGPYVPPQGDIVGEALVAANVPELAGQFSTLAGLLVRADLVKPLQAPAGPYTVFAPLNSAFEKVPVATLDAVYADPELLAAVLTYHVVAGEFPTSELTDGQELETLQGTTLTITKKGEKVMVNGYEIIAGDVPASNGLINVINDVLVPG